MKTPASKFQVPGLHHVTAIAGDPQRNIDFYTRVLGLRLVKKTVNFDDPSTYHLYYGDAVGSPGSILTFFPWTGLRRGRPGHGQVYATAFSVAADALDFWRNRLLTHHVAPTGPIERFGQQVLAFSNPDGLRLEFAATSEPDRRRAHPHPEIATMHAIRGIYGVTLALREAWHTQKLLTEIMGYRVIRTDGSRTQLAPVAAEPGTYVDLLVDPSIAQGLPGTGTVHHLAFRTPTEETQTKAQAVLLELGYQVSPVIERHYFRSIYYREPAGVLFEIATDSPGFAVDELVEALGTSLKLPKAYEQRRAEIEASLPPLK